MRQTGPRSKGYVSNLKGIRQCELPGSQIQCHGGATYHAPGQELANPAAITPR